MIESRAESIRHEKKLNRRARVSLFKTEQTNRKYGVATNIKEKFESSFIDTKYIAAEMVICMG